MATDTWLGGSGVYGGANWTPETPNQTNDDAALIDIAGLYTIILPAAFAGSPNTAGAGSVLFAASSGRASFLDGGDLVDTGSFQYLSGGTLDIQSGGTLDVGGQFTFDAGGAAGAAFRIETASTVLTNDRGTANAATTIENAGSVSIAGSLQTYGSLLIQGTTAAITPVMITGAIVLDSAGGRAVVGDGSEFRSAAITLATGASIALATTLTDGKTSLTIDAASAVTVTGNAMFTGGNVVAGNGGGVDDRAATTVQAGATLTIATAFTIDNTGGLSFSNNGVVAVAGAGGDLILAAASTLAGNGVTDVTTGGTIDDTADPGGANANFGKLKAVLNTGTIVFAPTASTTYTPAGIQVTGTSFFVFDNTAGAIPGAAVYNAIAQTVTFTSGSGQVDVVRNVTINGQILLAPLPVTTRGANSIVELTEFPCFAAGTRIGTTDGDVPVEKLRIGDRAIVLLGDERSARDIVWIGHRTVGVQAHSRPELVAPVTVEAWAIEAGVPAQNLVLSPDHALVLDGKRIAVRQLINGRTIRQDLGCTTVTYFHVELSEHSVLVAEGQPAESYLDTGNRAAFANGGTTVRMQPEFDAADTDTAAFAPLVTDALRVLPVWQRIADRAVTDGVHPLGMPATSEAGIHLIVDGSVVMPLRIEGTRHVFALPASATSVRLGSRAAMPSETQPWLDDRRRLGVAVSHIVQHNEQGMSVIGTDHPGFSDGWHGIERDAATSWRWTDGNAAIPAAAGVRTITVDVRATAAYPLAD